MNIVLVFGLILFLACFFALRSENKNANEMRITRANDRKRIEPTMDQALAKELIEKEQLEQLEQLAQTNKSQL